MSFVVSAEYGSLVDGYAATNEELSRLVNSPDFPRSCADEEQASMLLEERSEWLGCMKRCPMFVDSQL